MSAPLPGVPRPLLRPLACAYGAAVARRNRRFDLGEGVRRVALPVISIGNIVAGGSGKTPIATWLARQLLAEGVRPMIALRGYGGATPHRADEALEYGQLLPGVPIAAGADRATTIERALAGGAGADAVLLDDGFQHRRLHRDLDLVLVDGGRACLTPPDAELLPLGWLREPPAALRRASAVVVTHAPGEADEPPGAPGGHSLPPEAQELARAIERWHGSPPLAWFRHRWSGVDVYQHAATESPRRELVTHLRGLRVATLLGVAQPSRVLAMLQRAGAVVELNVPLRDHQRYDRAMLRGVVGRIAAASRSGTPIEAIVATSKDWTKLAEFASLLPCQVLVPRLEVVPVEGGDRVLDLALRCVGRPER